MSNGYDRAHQGVALIHGPARLHQCISCGRNAHEWAYQHNATEVLFWNSKPYTFDPRCYAPMCKSCHELLDLSKSENYSSLMKRVGENLGRYTKVRRKSDPAFDALIRETCRRNGKKAASVRVTCFCGLESTAAGMGTHKKFTGH